MKDLILIFLLITFFVIIDKLFFRLYIKWNKELFWDLYGDRIIKVFLGSYYD